MPEHSDDLISEMMRSFAEGCESIEKAAEEHLRLEVKKAEASLDRETASAKVEEVSRAMEKLGNGSEVQIHVEQRSEHGSFSIDVQTTPKPDGAHGRRRVIAIFAALIAFGSIGALWFSNSGRDYQATAQPSDHGSDLTVVRVIDGDTIVVRVPGSPSMEERVRFLAIDTPERGQPGYASASAALRSLVGQAHVSISSDDGKPLSRDRYGRLLAYVFVQSRNLNVEMVRLGWSPYVSTFGRSRFESDFIAAQNEARSEKRGVWNQSPDRQAD